MGHKQYGAKGKTPDKKYSDKLISRLYRRYLTLSVLGYYKHDVVKIIVAKEFSLSVCQVTYLLATLKV